MIVDGIARPPLNHPTFGTQQIELLVPLTVEWLEAARHL